MRCWVVNWDTIIRIFCMMLPFIIIFWAHERLIFMFIVARGNLLLWKWCFFFFRLLCKKWPLIALLLALFANSTPFLKEIKRDLQGKGHGRDWKWDYWRSLSSRKSCTWYDVEAQSSLNCDAPVASGLCGCLYWFWVLMFYILLVIKIYCIKVKLLSDNSGEADEQQTHSESQTQYSSPATEISHPCVPAPPVQYTSPLLGVGNTMVYIWTHPKNCINLRQRFHYISS